jgi:hypothetical protein
MVLPLSSRCRFLLSEFCSHRFRLLALECDYAESGGVVPCIREENEYKDARKAPIAQGSSLPNSYVEVGAALGSTRIYEGRQEPCLEY